MRNVLIVSLLAFCAMADKAVVQTMVCKTQAAFGELDDATKSDVMKLQRFANTHDCIIVSPVDKLQVVGENPAASQSRFVTIVMMRSGEQYVALRRDILIEQPGQENIIRF